jgi:hypothetical protein
MATYEELIAAAQQAKAEGRTEDVQSLVGQASELRKARESAAAAGDEGAIESVGRGIVTAPISLAQGVLELGAIGLDAAFDTNTLRPTTEFFEGIKEDIKPERALGQATEEIVGFGLGFIPIAGWLGRAGHVARTGKGVTSSSRFMKSAEEFGSSAAGKKILSSKAGLFGTTAAATGLYEGVFSPSGRETLSDSFSMLPDALKTEGYGGESGRAEAGRQLRNKMRQSAEAAALSTGFDTLLYGLGKGGRQVAALPGVNETLSATARGVTGAFDLVGRGAMALPRAARAKAVFDRYFTPTKGADRAVVSSIQDAEGLSKSEKNTAVQLVTAYENAMKKALKDIRRQNGTKLAMKEAEKDTYDFLVGGLGADVIESRYGPEVLKSLEDVVSQGTRLQDILVRQLEDVARTESSLFRTAAAPFAPGAAVTGRGNAARSAINDIKELQKTQRTHLSRMFDVHQNPLSFYAELGEDFMQQKPFQTAVEDLMRYNTQKNPANYGTPEARENATRLVLDIVGLGEISSGVAPTKAIQNQLDKIRRQAGDTGGLVTNRQSLFKLADEMLIPRKDLITEVPAVRAFMGEVTDPKALAVQTINKMAETTTAFDFYRNVARANSESAGAALPKIREGARPMVVQIPNPQTMSPEQYTAEVSALQAAGFADVGTAAGNARVEEALELNGYRKLGEFNPDSALGGQYGDLSGAYVPEEVYANLTAPIGLTAHPASQAASIVNQIKGLSQKMLIVPNVASRVRDFLGNQLMRVATGNSPSMYDQDYLGAAQVFLRSASSLTDEGMRNLKTKLDAAGVTDSSVLLNAIKQYQEEGSAIGAAQKTRKVIEGYENLPGLKQVMSFFEGITDNIDGYAKAAVMLGEEAKLKEVFNGAKIANAEQLDSALNWMQRSGIVDRTRSEVLDFAADAGRPGVRMTPIEIVAADRTKRMMPTYSQIGSAVKTIDRALPFGNFTSFASENIRNLSNILDIGLKELSAVADDALIAELGEESARALVRQTRAVGAQRLMGLLTVAAITPKAMVRASMNATGTTDEQMERLYEQVPEYLSGHDLIITENDGKGEIGYVDLSYVAPYSFVTDAINAGLRSYSERGRLDKSEADQLATAAFSTISSLADPFAAESMIFERVRDSLPAAGFPGIGRGGRTSTGGLIYRDTDDVGTKASKGFLHVMDGLAPAFTKVLGEARRGDPEPGRLTRAMMGTPGARGEDYNGYEELARQVTGFTPMKLNLRRDFEFSGKEYSPRRSDAKTAANSVILRGDATVPEMLSAWDNYLNTLYREQSKLYNDIQAARTLGLSEAEIRRNLTRKANLGTAEVAMIMRGQFYPGMASEELAQSMREQLREGRSRLTTRVPFRELNKLSRERMRQPLSPEMFRLRQEGQAEVAAPAPAAAPSDNVFSGIAQGPAVTPAPVALPAPAPAAQQAQQAPAGNIPPLGLLGSDPVSQARNAEIAQRRTN